MKNQTAFPKLTSREQSHIAKGGRVFIANETPDHFWQVLIVKKISCEPMLNAEWASMDRAFEFATSIAMLSADNPIVRDMNHATK